MVAQIVWLRRRSENWPKRVKQPLLGTITYRGLFHFGWPIERCVSRWAHTTLMLAIYTHISRNSLQTRSLARTHTLAQTQQRLIINLLCQMIYCNVLIPAWWKIFNSNVCLSCTLASARVHTHRTYIPKGVINYTRVNKPVGFAWTASVCCPMFNDSASTNLGNTRVRAPVTYPRLSYRGNNT